MATRRDYVATAAIIKEHVTLSRRQEVTDAFARYFEKDNPNFDRDRFYIAVGCARPEAGTGRARA